MKLVSKLAVAVGVAAIAGIGISASPAVAQKNKKAEAPATPALSKEFRAAGGPVQAAVTAKAFADALPKLDALDAVAVSPYEKFVAAQFRYQAALGVADKAMEARALEAMLASGAAPADLAPKVALQLGSNAYAAGDSQRAIRFLTEAERLGAKDEQLALLIADSNFRLKNYAAGLAALERGIAQRPATSGPVPEDWYKRAVQAAMSSKSDAEFGKWSRKWVGAYPTPVNWRAALTLFRDASTRGPQVNIDVFRLMRAAKALDGARDYNEYASLAYDTGLPGEAKAVVDEGFALGKIPPNTRALTELRTLASAKIAADRASLPASERASAASARTALATGDAFMAYGEDAKAIPLYQSAITKGGIDLDAANLRLGMALIRSGQRDAAKSAFAKVSPTGPRGELAAYWMLFASQGA